MSGETKWTPGPWAIAKRGRDRRSERLGWLEIRDANGCPVVHAGSVTIWQEDGGQDHDAGVRMSEADAALIAAAPDLYEALAAVVDAIPVGKVSIAARVALDNARAALAKARGGR
jgi:hypothetical protein